MVMLCKDNVKSAYSFLHQKNAVYRESSSPAQKDDIEYAVSSFANMMDRELYGTISKGKSGFLMEHADFAVDLASAVSRLERML